MGEPPSDTGSVKATEAPEMPGVATAEVGAAGSVAAPTMYGPKTQTAQKAARGVDKRLVVMDHAFLSQSRPL